MIKKIDRRINEQRIAADIIARCFLLYIVLFRFLVRRQSFWFWYFIFVGVAIIYWHFTISIRKFEIRKSASSAQYFQNWRSLLRAKTPWWLRITFFNEISSIYTFPRVQFHYTFSFWKDRDVSSHPFVDNLQM